MSRLKKAAVCFLQHKVAVLVKATKNPGNVLTVLQHHQDFLVQLGNEAGRSKKHVARVLRFRQCRPKHAARNGDAIVLPLVVVMVVVAMTVIATAVVSLLPATSTTAGVRKTTVPAPLATSLLLLPSPVATLLLRIYVVRWLLSASPTATTATRARAPT